MINNKWQTEKEHFKCKIRLQRFTCLVENITQANRLLDNVIIRLRVPRNRIAKNKRILVVPNPHKLLLDDAGKANFRKTLVDKFQSISSILTTPGGQMFLSIERVDRSSASSRGIPVMAALTIFSLQTPQQSRKQLVINHIANKSI